MPSFYKKENRFKADKSTAGKHHQNHHSTPKASQPKPIPKGMTKDDSHGWSKEHDSHSSGGHSHSWTPGTSPFSNWSSSSASSSPESHATSFKGKKDKGHSGHGHT